MSEPWKWGDEVWNPKPEYKEPTGRHLCCGMDAEMKSFADGDWVPYNDYARLKSEVERLTNENGNNSVLKEEWYLKCLSAREEVERLKGIIFAQSSEFVRNAAKEGKPSV